jgi:hypothetical protein
MHNRRVTEGQNAIGRVLQLNLRPMWLPAKFNESRCNPGNGHSRSSERVHNHRRHPSGPIPHCPNTNATCLRDDRRSGVVVLGKGDRSHSGSRPNRVELPINVLQLTFNNNRCNTGRWRNACTRKRPVEVSRSVLVRSNSSVDNRLNVVHRLCMIVIAICCAACMVGSLHRIRRRNVCKWSVNPTPMIRMRAHDAQFPSSCNSRFNSRNATESIMVLQMMCSMLA